MKEARGEIRRVVWPTSQETTQTTLVVSSVGAGFCADSVGSGFSVELDCQSVIG